MPIEGLKTARFLDISPPCGMTYLEFIGEHKYVSIGLAFGPEPIGCKIIGC